MLDELCADNLELERHLANLQRRRGMPDGQLPGSIARCRERADPAQRPTVAQAAPGWVGLASRGDAPPEMPFAQSMPHTSPSPALERRRDLPKPKRPCGGTKS